MRNLAVMAALLASCGDHTGGRGDLGADLAIPGSDLASLADLSGADGALDMLSCAPVDIGSCSAPIGGTDSCCVGLRCSATHVCTSSCGFSGATCATSAECCYNLWCEGNGCHGCLGGGRQAAGQPCPGGNSDCCSNNCGTDGRCAM
jgi:hypothetical protein